MDMDSPVSGTRSVPDLMDNSLYCDIHHAPKLRNGLSDGFRVYIISELDLQGENRMTGWRNRQSVLALVAAAYTQSGMMLHLEKWKGWEKTHTLATAVLSSFAQSDSTAMLLFFLLFLLFSDMLRRSASGRRNSDRIKTLLFAGLYAFAVFIGRGVIQGDGTADIQIDRYHLLIYAYAFGAFWLFFYVALTFLRTRFFDVRQDADEYEERGLTAFCRRRMFWIALISLLILYLPVIVATYPGLPMGDTEAQIGEAIPLAGDPALVKELRNYHSAVQTLLMNGCIRLGKLALNSFNMGLYLYTLIQAGITMIIFAYGIHLLAERFSVSLLGCALLVLYLGLHPRIQNYIVLLTKDILYTDFLLLYVMLVAAASHDPERVKTGTLLAIGVSAAFTIIFRHDGILLVFAGLIPLFFLKRFRVKAIALCLCCFGFSLVWNQICIPSMGVKRSADRKEALCFPLQQLCRVLKDAPETFSQEELEDLSQVINIPFAQEMYNRDTADWAKHSFVIDADNGQILKMLTYWGKALVRTPRLCFLAYVDSKDQMIYPSRQSLFDYSYPAGDAILELINERQHTDFSVPAGLGQFRKEYEAKRELFLKIPFLGILTNSAFHIWMGVLLVYLLSRGRKASVWVFVCVSSAMVLMNLLMTPMDGDYFRYIYPLCIVLPFFFLAGHAEVRTESISAVAEK